MPLNTFLVFSFEHIIHPALYASPMSLCLLLSTPQGSRSYASLIIEPPKATVLVTDTELEFNICVDLNPGSDSFVLWQCSTITMAVSKGQLYPSGLSALVLSVFTMCLSKVPALCQKASIIVIHFQSS